MNDHRRRARTHRIAIAAVGLAALTASIVATPTADANLPSIALGWPLLLLVERAAALVAIVSLAVLIGWRASLGQLPIKFAYLEYETELAIGTDQALEAHEHRIAQLEARLQLLEDVDRAS